MRLAEDTRALFDRTTVTISDVKMAAKFSISDSESEPSEELEEEESQQESPEQEQQAMQRLGLTLPDFRTAATGRIRLNSESLAATFSRDEELQLQARGEEEAGTPTEGAPFRGRSKSAPPALWAAKKYGQKLRRMSDEFDSLLDKGEMKKLRNPGTARQIHHSRSWWSYLFSHQETEGENHHENHAHERTEQSGASSRPIARDDIKSSLDAALQ